VHLRIFNAHNRLCAEVINKKVFIFMKKKLLAIASGCVVAASLMIAGIASDGKSDGIFDENVEALAESESDGKGCYETIIYYPRRQVFYCGTCSFIDGDDPWYAFKHYGICK